MFLRAESLQLVLTLSAIKVSLRVQIASLIARAINKIHTRRKRQTPKKLKSLAQKVSSGLRHIYQLCDNRLP